MRKPTKSDATWVVFFTLLIAADQASKYYARTTGFGYTEHSKAIWLVVLALIYLAYWSWSEADFRQTQSKLAISLVAAGGVSNLIDLTTQNLVTNIFTAQNLHFNLADIFILVGLTIISIHSFRPRNLST